MSVVVSDVSALTLATDLFAKLTVAKWRQLTRLVAKCEALFMDPGRLVGLTARHKLAMHFGYSSAIFCTDWVFRGTGPSMKIASGSLVRIISTSFRDDCALEASTSTSVPGWPVTRRSSSLLSGVERGIRETRTIRGPGTS
jgi:hypothetical protein